LESDTLTAHDAAPPPEEAGAVAIRRIEKAVAALLAAQQSRAALAWADREILTPHVWMVADLCSAETTALATWLQQLHDRLEELNVEARLYLLLRHLSWGLNREQQLDAAIRTRSLVEHLVGETTPGHVSIMAYVLTDRDAIGGYYDEAKRETISLAFRLTDLLLLSDAAHGNAPGSEHTFVAPVNGAPGPWETLPIFGSAAAACLQWDTPALERATAEERRAHLFSLLSAATPPTYDPDYPHLGSVRLASEGRWPQLDVPRWSPRFWRSARQEHDRYRDLLDRWIPTAARWRHEMLVTHRDRCRSVDRHAASVLTEYEADLDTQERRILADDSLRGFFAPLHRLYDRATADLQVQQLELGDPPSSPPAPFDAITAIPLPKNALASTDDKLVTALERKINPWLLLQITLMTIAIAWGLMAWTFLELKQNLPNMEAVDEYLSEYGWDRARNLAEWFVTVTGAIPDNAQIILYTGAPIIALVVATAVLTALRQRIVLERAWNIPYRRASRWRDTAIRALQEDVRTVEQSLARANLGAAEAMIVERRERLTAFEKLGFKPLSAAPDDDEAVTGVLRPAAWAAAGLSDLQVSQITVGFKQICSRIPSSQWTPEHLLQELFTEAASQAGDPPLDLRQELVPVRRRILRAMPPDGAVRVQQLPTTSPAERAAPKLARFLAAPAAVAGDLRFEPHVAIVAPLPIDTRFYAAILQSGMSARRILSRSTPWDCDPLNPAITPQPAAPISGAVPEGPESAPGAPTTVGDAAPDDASDLSGEIASDSATPGAVLAVESSDWWSASDSPYSSADVEPVAPLTPPVADADASPGGAGAETDASGPADPEAELLAAGDASTAPLA
ncbi:MAG: hypothetical protein KC432_05020, partial [Thermomicrobiales bacterium]|nr:hypothetical protein [Thermomicrobiales bacterium]